MRFDQTIDIDAPIEHVVQVFCSIEVLFDLEPSMVDFQVLKGGSNSETGSESLRTFEVKGQRYQVLQSVIENNAPDSFSMLLNADDYSVFSQTKLIELGQERTCMQVHTEITYTNYFWKIVLVLVPWFTARYLKRELKEFKAYTESKANR